MVVALVLLSALGAVPPTGAAQESAWPPVAAADMSRLRPSDFTDDEVDLPYYLAHFHRVANAVVPSGPNRGFIDIPVWRARKDNAPHNARIMESLLSLAWFYTAKRPWNPYYGAPELRVRLEAALDFWCRSQNADGRFSEYGPGRWNLAATAFATKFMGETLALLEDGPAIDAALRARAIAADRKAIEAVLSLPELYDHGRRFTNQYTNVYAGALAYLDLYPDPELEARLHARIREASSRFQSPAGYFYEEKGPDYSYNLGTHQSNLRMALHYTRGTPLGELLITENRRFFEWLGYNAVPEPHGDGFTLNRGVETRQEMPYLDRRRGDRRGAPPAEAVEAYPFLPTREEQAAAVAALRQELERDWPRVAPLDLERPSAFSPYTFLHRRHPRFLPARTDRDAAVARLPLLRRDRFIHQRMDDREGLVFTYVRRPAYYAVFNTGPSLTEQQRYGLGLVWSPSHGALLQTQSGSIDAAWGTRTDGASHVHETALAAEVSADGQAVAAQAGARDIEGRRVEVSYRVGGQGRKRVTFGESEIRVSVEHRGRLREQLPLLVAEDGTVERKGRTVVLSAGGRPALVIAFDHARVADVRTLASAAGRKTVVVVVLRARGRLEYTLSFP